MRIIVVDHLPCENNELGLCTGTVPQGVSEFGRRLAHLVKVQAAERGQLSAVFASNLPRAVESAELCFSRFDVPLIYDPRLRAIDYGTYQEATLDAVESVQKSYVYEPFPGGESYQDMAERYCSFLGEVVERYASTSVVLIGHYGTRQVLRHLCEGVALHEALRRPQRQVVSDRHGAISARFERAEYAEFDFYGKWGACSERTYT